MKILVQKFGGTSVADPDAVRRLIEIARAARTRDRSGPVLVVSAMSKVTDALLTIAAEAGAAKTDTALTLVDQVLEHAGPGDLARLMTRRGDLLLAMGDPDAQAAGAW